METHEEKAKNLKPIYPCHIPKPRPFDKGVNPEGLIDFTMPETYDPEFKGLDIYLACESTYIYARSRTNTMKEK